jgi:hypothetical protein
MIVKLAELALEYPGTLEILGASGAKRKNPAFEYGFSVAVMFDMSDDVASEPYLARTVVEVVAFLHEVDLAEQ